MISASSKVVNKAIAAIMAMADCLLQGMPSTKDLVPVHQQ
jgi:hypothetical protein